MTKKDEWLGIYFMVFFGFIALLLDILSPMTDIFRRRMFYLIEFSILMIFFWRVVCWFRDVPPPVISGERG